MLVFLTRSLGNVYEATEMLRVISKPVKGENFKKEKNVYTINLKDFTYPSNILYPEKSGTKLQKLNFCTCNNLYSYHKIS